MKNIDWPLLEKEVLSLIEGEKNLIANLANISAHLFHTLSGLNWCGFYLWNEQDQELILGPFQGKPACIRIKSGKGVCGTSFQKQETVLVEDVHRFPGHITCDPASNSEIVIPIGKLGVLDIDSPNLNHFSKNEAEALTKIMNRIMPLLAFESLPIA